jgi:anti-sigma regulatory factor (Ser/Thr protein kinase)
MTAERWTMSAGRKAPGLARQFAREYAGRQGADSGTVEAIALCVTEAVTNVVVHAYRDADQPGAVEVEIRRPDGYLCLYVRDDGVGLVPRVDSPGLGLGLPLISGTASSTEVRTLAGGGTEIVMRFDFRQPAETG